MASKKLEVVPEWVYRDLINGRKILFPMPLEGKFYDLVWEGSERPYWVEMETTNPAGKKLQGELFVWYCGMNQKEFSDSFIGYRNKLKRGGIKSAAEMLHSGGTPPIVYKGKVYNLSLGFEGVPQIADESGIRVPKREKDAIYIHVFGTDAKGFLRAFKRVGKERKTVQKRHEESKTEEGASRLISAIGKLIKGV